jgi:hypothetical protein
VTQNPAAVKASPATFNLSRHSIMALIATGNARQIIAVAHVALAEL